MNDGVRGSMKELKPCPLCGSTPLLSAGPYDWDGGGRYYYYSAAIECTCGLTLEVDNPRPKEYTNYTKALDFAIAAWNARAVSGDTSDGYHTFDELYYHRTALFACLVSMQPRQMAFKSWKHADGAMYDGMFIAGIYTSKGWCTYHCEAEWWPLFDCSEREFAPEWDGHTPSDAIHRLMHDMLPKQEVSGEVD